MIEQVMMKASNISIKLMGGNFQSQVVMVSLGAYGIYKIRDYYKKGQRGFEI